MLQFVQSISGYCYVRCEELIFEGICLFILYNFSRIMRHGTNQIMIKNNFKLLFEFLMKCGRKITNIIYKQKEIDHTHLIIHELQGDEMKKDAQNNNFNQQEIKELQLMTAELNATQAIMESLNDRVTRIETFLAWQNYQNIS